MKLSIPVVILGIAGLLATPSARALSYQWTYFAGMPGGNGNVDGTGSAARFGSPVGVAVDGSGNLYVADQFNHTIRKVTSAGGVTTVAGLAGYIGSDEGTGEAARFNNPSGVTVDGSGNIYVADTNNHTIRKISSGGVVTTLAGNAGSAGSADGTGSAAQFSSPTGVTVDGSGNVYVADYGNHTIRKISSGGVVTTLAGSAGSAGSTDGTGSTAQFSSPTGVTVDGSGNVYVADTNNHTIRKITSGGVVTTLAGNAGNAGSADGIGSTAQFSSPTGVTVDGSGNVHVADTNNHTIRKITSGGVVTTLAGSAGNAGSADGIGGIAQFSSPTGVTADGSGNVYVADKENSTIRKITGGGVVTTLAGSAPQNGSADGTGSAAQFYFPTGVAMDNSGNVYVADTYNHTIRKITNGGVVTTLAGSAGSAGSADGTGSAAQFYFPTGVAVDSSGNIYVTDASNHTIRKITSDGVVTTLAGSAGSYGSADGTGSAAQFYFPTGVAVESSGNVYVADAYNHTIRKITSGGVVTTLAGSAGSYGSADGTGSDARFQYPYDVAMDSSGNVYVADTYNHTIRKITSGGVVTTLAGSADNFGSADGTGSAAQFYFPTGVAVDSSGNVYVADNVNSTIRKITSDGVVKTIGGTAGVVDELEGTGTSALLCYPSCIAVSSAGTLFVTSNNLVMQGQPIYSATDLTSLVLNSGSLNPGFDSATTSYTATVSNLQTSISVTPSAFQAGANIQVNGVAVASGSPSNDIPLNIGANAITVKVTAADGMTTANYSILVTRLSADDVDLADLTVDGGTLNPAFSSNVLNYTVAYASTPASTLITPVPMEPFALVHVNGVNPPFGQRSITVALQPGANTINIDVFALDNSTRRYTVTINKEPPPTLPEALDTPSQSYTLAGNADWHGQTSTTYDGVDAAQSGDISDSQESLMETQVTGPGSLGFWWKVSSESNYDFLEFYIDGVLQSGRISGEVDWQQKSFVLSSGDHTLGWRYAKDQSSSSGADAGWVDQVTISPIRYTLTINASGGTVDISPLQDDYAPGSIVTLTAIPNSGELFFGWSGDASGTSNPLNISLNADMVVNAAFGVPLDVALETSGLTWTTGGDNTWAGQTSTTHDGVDAAQSGVTGQFREAWMETQVTGPGSLSFWWKVSSVINYDYLEFYIDGVLQSGRISGEVDWQQMSFPITSGNHTLRWKYRNNFIYPAGADAGWVDQIAWIPTVGYASWQSTFFTAVELGDPLISGPNADPDHDGIPNLLEWAFNLNPTTVGTQPFSTARNGANFEYTYTRSVEALNAGVTFTVEWSDTLAAGSWSNAGVTEQVLSNDGTVQQVKATIPAGSGSRRFAHLKVTGPP